MLILTACNSGNGKPLTPIPTKELYPSPAGEEAYDDIVPAPGAGPIYRANFNLGEDNPWPQIEVTDVFLDSGSNETRVIYRDYIETKTGETRKNIIKVIIPNKNAHSLNLYANDIPTGITLNVGMQWSGPGTKGSVLVIEIAEDVATTEYTIEIGLEINDEDYGTIPCTIKVID